MTPLISKVQYKRSEKGEFHDIASRNFEDTISLILNYPWNTERSLATIKLSCPSVTIEHPVRTYLKVGPYFSGKFSIYYLDTNNKIYLKIVNTLEDACAMVKTYFEQKGKLQGFEKYGFTINPLAHFKTHPFEYMADINAIISFFRFPIYLVPLILFMGWLKHLQQPLRSISDATVFMILFYLLLWSPLIYLFFNYLSVDKSSYIQISRGHDEFVYGTIDNKELYTKQDIAEINAYGVYYSRSLWSECEIFIITFKNGTQIQFTSLLIAGDKLRQKFPDHKIMTNKKFFPKIENV